VPASSLVVWFLRRLTLLAASFAALFQSLLAVKVRRSFLDNYIALAMEDNPPVLPHFSDTPSSKK
jgi:hydrogenase-4 membrane subunit HyfE